MKRNQETSNANPIVDKLGKKQKTAPDSLQNLTAYLEAHEDQLLAEQLKRGDKVVFKAKQPLWNDGINFLAQVLSLNGSITGLDLSNQQLKAPAVNKLLSSLKQNTEVKMLVLSSYMIRTDVSVCNNLAEILKLSVIQDISLSCTDIIYNKAFPQLVDSIKNNNIITSLNLAGNYGEPEGMKALAAVLPSLPNLTSLNLGYNQAWPEGMKFIADALPSLPNLTSLNLAGNDGRPEGMKFIADALPSLPNLTSLNLAGNDGRPEGMKFIADALPSLPNLTSLNLAGNYGGPEEMKFIADALLNLPNLTSLNLAGNDGEPEGMKSLAAVLPGMTNLTHLDLGYNEAGPEGMKSLAAALPTMPNLTSLDLQYNQAGPEGMKSFVAGVKENFSLIEVMLSDVSHGGREEMDSYLDRNKEMLKAARDLVASYFIDRDLKNDKVVFENIPHDKYSSFAKYQKVSKVALGKELGIRGKEEYKSLFHVLDNMIDEKFMTISGICKNPVINHVNDEGKVINSNVVESVTLPGFICSYICSFLDRPTLSSVNQNIVKLQDIEMDNMLIGADLSELTL